MFESYHERYLLCGDGQTNYIQCADIRKSLLQGTSYIVSIWNPSLDYKSDNTLDPSTFPIGFGRDENGSPSTVSAIFTDKDLKVYSRTTAPLLSSVTTVTSVPTSMYISSTRTYYTTSNTIYDNTNSKSAVIKRQNNQGVWVEYTDYNPTGIVKDKRDIYWICSKSLGRISRLANNIDSLSGGTFIENAGRIDYEEEIKDAGMLLKPTGLAVLPEKSAMFDTDLDESGRFWICCDNGYIYEIKVNLFGGLEILESMSGTGPGHFITCYTKEDL